MPGAVNATDSAMRSAVDAAFWRGRRVLVTGHNGFKGAWLCLWLQALGARVHGVSLSTPPTTPSLYELADVEQGMASAVACDVRDGAALAAAVNGATPEVVFHLAAQPLVRASFAAPANTFAVNALGTAALLDAVRGNGDPRGSETVRDAAAPGDAAAVRAVVVVTSDKCYAPSPDGRAHVEGDPLGGEDPYSASKACAELVVASYRDSFFSAAAGPRVATARAGNVIGGGDFGAERLLPDVFRAALAGEPLLLRNPDAVRPWQHVLSPLSGYLALAQALCGPEPARFARAWNFGPSPDDALTVREIVALVADLWPEPLAWRADEREHPPENPALRLDSSQARAELGWQPLLTLEQGLALTAEWFRGYAADPAEMRVLTLAQVELSASATTASERGLER